VCSGEGESEGGRRGEGAVVRHAGATVVEGVAVRHGMRDANVPGAGVESGQIADESRGRDQMRCDGVGRLFIGTLVVLAEERDFAIRYCLAGGDRPCGLGAGVGRASDMNAWSDGEDNASVRGSQGGELKQRRAACLVIYWIAAEVAFIAYLDAENR